MTLRTLLLAAGVAFALTGCAQAAPPAADPSPPPSASAAARTWDELPADLLEASATVAAEKYVPPPEPEPAPTDEYGYSPDDPMYRPPGLDPCEPNAHGIEDNDACLEANGYPIPET